jgi:hypothetical protein
MGVIYHVYNYADGLEKVLEQRLLPPITADKHS